MSGRRGSKRNNERGNRGHRSRYYNDYNDEYPSNANNNHPPYNNYNARAEYEEYMAQAYGNNNGHNPVGYNQYNQEAKLVQLHKKQPNKNVSMAEEIQRKYMHPRKVERYIEMREAAGVPFEDIFKEIEEGGVVTEGVGKAPVVNNPNNLPYLVKKANAAAMGLFNANNANPAVNPGGAAAGGWGGGARKRKAQRKTRRKHRQRKTRRN
jgi:hypothetical protein